MIGLLLLATLPAAATLAQAEQAITEKARADGPWAAFRAFKAPEAWLLDPDMQRAATVFDRRGDPGQQRQWSPARGVVSCDGSLAVSSGPFRGGDGRNGRYFTIWERQPDRRWRWVFDGTIKESGVGPVDYGSEPIVAECRAQPVALDPRAEAAGASGDGTVRWTLKLAPERDGYRLLVRYWAAGAWQVFEDAKVG